MLKLWNNGENCIALLIKAVNQILPQVVLGVLAENP